jgi:curved DNA-binding protein CbpA
MRLLLAILLLVPSVSLAERRKSAVQEAWDYVGSPEDRYNQEQRYRREQTEAMQKQNEILEDMRRQQQWDSIQAENDRSTAAFERSMDYSQCKHKYGLMANCD